MPPRPLAELYTKLAPNAAETLQLPERPRETGHFNVFNVADLMLANRDRPPKGFFVFGIILHFWKIMAVGQCPEQNNE